MDPLQPSSSEERAKTSESATRVLTKRLYNAAVKMKDLQSFDTAATEAKLWIAIMNFGFEKEAKKLMNDSITLHRQKSVGRPWIFLEWGTDAGEVLVRAK